MYECPGPCDANDPYQYPECIQQYVSLVLAHKCTPGKQRSINGVEYPHKHKRAVGTKPADERKTENPHDYTRHFEGLHVRADKGIHFGQLQDDLSLGFTGRLMGMEAGKLS